MKQRLMLATLPLIIGFSGCSNMQLGTVGSMATGSAGDAGNQGATRELAHCNEKVGTVALEENPQGYSYVQFLGSGGVNLPRSPLPLLKLMLQQTGCFSVVDRGRGLNAIVKEQALQSAGMTRRQKNVTKGNIIEAHYTLVPDLAFSNEDAGGGVAAAGAVLGYFVPYGGLLAMGAGSIRFKEAQVVLSLVDNNTSEQISASEGSATATDYGIGAAFIGGLTGAGAAGWKNTAEGKVVIAAFIDAINKLIPQIRTMGPAGPVPQKKRR